MGVAIAKEKLYSNIESSNIEEIDIILGKYPQLLNAPITDDCQSTALGRACQRGDFKLVQYLIQRGCQVNYTGPKGLTPLMLATIKGHLQIIQLLIDWGADTQLFCPNQNKALDYAILYGNYKCALYLVKLDMSPETLQSIKSVIYYENYAKSKQIYYVNYYVLVRHLKSMISYENLPDIFQRPETKKKLKDPVIDPREPWSEFFKRILEFKEPPLCERDELPVELRPEKRILGRFQAYIYDMNIDQDKQDINNFENHVKYQKQLQGNSFDSESSTSNTSNIKEQSNEFKKDSTNNDNQLKDISIE